MDEIEDCVLCFQTLLPQAPFIQGGNITKQEIDTCVNKYIYSALSNGKILSLLVGRVSQGDFVFTLSPIIQVIDERLQEQKVDHWMPNLTKMLCLSVQSSDIGN